MRALSIVVGTLTIVGLAIIVSPGCQPKRSRRFVSAGTIKGLSTAVVDPDAELIFHQHAHPTDYRDTLYFEAITSSGAAMDTATLVGPTSLLTARHSVEGMNDIAIVFGSSPPVNLQCELDPYYDQVTHADDLALCDVPRDATASIAKFERVSTDPSTQSRFSRVLMAGFGGTGGPATLTLKLSMLLESPFAATDPKPTLLAVGQQGVDGDSGSPVFTLDASGNRMVSAVAVMRGDLTTHETVFATLGSSTAARFVTDWARRPGGNRIVCGINGATEPHCRP